MKQLGFRFLWVVFFLFPCLVGAMVVVAPATPAAWEALLGRFKRVGLRADLAGLSPGDRQAVEKLVHAAEALHSLYLTQVWEGNAAFRKKLLESREPLAKFQLRFFDQHGGPWAEDFSLIPSKAPLGAGFYPEDMSKQEFETWVGGLSGPAEKLAKGTYSVIRRQNGKLVSVPYHVAYADGIKPVVADLVGASELATTESLKRFLKLRAAALLDDDYFASDVAWLELEGPVEITIGPYETYDDKLFGYKASYEVFLGIVDAGESKVLSSLAKELQYLENNLPIEDRFKNPNLGKVSPIKIVNLIYSAGDARSGIMTAAYNLPNDEAVLSKHGSKKVMLKNVQQEKFNSILLPLARLAVGKREQGRLSFQAFFTHILAHELAHGLGPHDIKVGGKATTVRQELKEQYAALEEAKADILGVFALQMLVEKGAVSKELKQTLASTYLASAFRSVRFGVGEAHGRGQALQFNYLWDKGAISYDKQQGSFSVAEAKFPAAVRELTGEILRIQAEGSYEKAKVLLDKYGLVRPEMKKVLDKASSLPVDIEPNFALFASAN